MRNAPGQQTRLTRTGKGPIATFISGNPSPFNPTFIRLTWRIMAVVICLIAVFIPIPTVAEIPSSTVPEVSLQMDLDYGVLPADRTGRAIMKISLEAPPPPSGSERPPVNLVVVLDRSGSMQGDKLENAKEAAIEALRRLGPSDFFSVVIYDHNIETIVPAQSAANTEWIESRIHGIRAGGYTALFGGVSQGAAELRKNMGAGHVHRMILLSDGIANVGPSNPDDLGRLGKALLKEGISVTTVGLGMDYNEDLMTRLSQNSDGNTYFVESSRDLPRVFTAELGDVLSVVARHVHIHIHFPDGVRPIRIIGRDGRLKSDGVELSFNQLYGNQTKYVLVEVEVEQNPHGRRKEIGQAEVSYENMFSHQKTSRTGNVFARFSNSETEVRQSANLDVQREYQLNLTALAQEEAIRLADEGKPEAAVQHLRETTRELKAFGEASQDPVIERKRYQMETKLEQLEKEGMTGRSRKEMITDSYQMKQQQETR